MEESKALTVGSGGMPVIAKAELTQTDLIDSSISLHLSLIDDYFLKASTRKHELDKQIEEISQEIDKTMQKEAEVHAIKSVKKVAAALDASGFKVEKTGCDDETIREKGIITFRKTIEVKDDTNNYKHVDNIASAKVTIQASASLMKKIDKCQDMILERKRQQKICNSCAEQKGNATKMRMDAVAMLTRKMLEGTPEGAALNLHLDKIKRDFEERMRKVAESAV